MLCEEGDSELTLMPPHMETRSCHPGSGRMSKTRAFFLACDSLALNGDEGACLLRLF